ncbi:MAG: metal-dependent hydrolase [Spirochaetaceae bacterium]|nr:MAG: metal-dependent hydrolase [Spirochaetaceae bacterium]
MSLEITFLGHSGFRLSDGLHSLVIDPFLTGNPLATISADQVTCDYIALTHGHADHIGDTVGIAGRTNATVIAAFEICNYLAEQGLTRVEPGNHGGRIPTAFGSVAFTQAFHSSSYEGRYMGMPAGLVVRMGGHTFYHAGDTDIFSDMQLIGQWYKPDIAAVPVGDRFTMGPELAARACELIGAGIAIPIHYRTFDLLRQDCAGFRPKDVKVLELNPGDTHRLV